MEPRFEEKREFCVIGLGGQIERGKTEDIGKKLWPEFSRRFGEIKNKIGKDQNGYVTYGVCQEVWIDGCIQDYFNYFAAVEVEPGTPVPGGMEFIKIEKQKYAVFTHRTGLKNLEHTNQYIWGTWLPQSGYELSPASDLEVYPSNFSPPEHEVPFDIWVPIDSNRRINDKGQL